MSCFMGIDLGTSSVKTIIMEEDGKVRAVAAQDYQFSSPYNNYAEQEPEDWWEACVKTIGKSMETGGVSAEEIRAVSFSGQMHGLVALDKEYRPVRPAILHCDARSGRQIKEIQDKLGEERVKEWMMNPVYSGFLLPSLLWVKEDEPQSYDKIRHVCLPKDYLKLKLSGEVTSDYSDASATLAFDIRKREWSKEILAMFGLPEEWFPKCYEVSEACGAVSKWAAGQTGLAEGTLIVAGGGDQVMQGIGNGIVRTGQASANIGTSGQVSFQSDVPILNPKLNTNTFAGYQKGRWITMGAIMNAGLCYKWFNSLFPKTDYEDMNLRISKVAPGSGGVIFLPYLNGERTPHLNPDLSGAFFGVNLKTGREQLAKAVMEGVSFALNQCIEICGELGLHADSMVASGGGSHSRPWLQIQADIYNTPLKVADTDEQAGLGAAIAASVGAGLYKDIEEGCSAAVTYKDFEVIPDAQSHRIYMEYYHLYKELYSGCGDTLRRVTLLGRGN